MAPTAWPDVLISACPVMNLFGFGQGTKLYICMYFTLYLKRHRNCFKAS